MHLLELTIENARSLRVPTTIDFRDTEGRPARLKILAGPNGCGKTTVLHAIAHVLGATDPRLEAEQFTTDDLSRATSKGAARGRIEATFADPEVFTPHDGRGRIGPWTDVFPLLTREGFTLEEMRLGAAARTQAPSRDDFRRTESPLGILFPVRRTPTRRAPADLSRWGPQRRTTGALSRDESRFEGLDVLLALAAIAPDVFDRDGRFARLWLALQTYFGDEAPSILRGPPDEPRFDVRGSPVTWSQLSDGQRAILTLLSEVAFRHPQDGIVLLDEIEQHLHPRWQRLILQTLLAYAPDVQFICTTHSIVVAESFQDSVSWFEQERWG